MSSNGDWYHDIMEESGQLAMLDMNTEQMMQEFEAAEAQGSFGSTAEEATATADANSRNRDNELMKIDSNMQQDPSSAPSKTDPLSDKGGQGMARSVEEDGTPTTPDLPPWYDPSGTILSPEMAEDKHKENQEPSSALPATAGRSAQPRQPSQTFWLHVEQSRLASASQKAQQSPKLTSSNVLVKIELRADVSHEEISLKEQDAATDIDSQAGLEETLVASQQEIQSTGDVRSRFPRKILEQYKDDIETGDHSSHTSTPLVDAPLQGVRPPQDIVSTKMINDMLVSELLPTMDQYTASEMAPRDENIGVQEQKPVFFEESLEGLVIAEATPPSEEVRM